MTILAADSECLTCAPHAPVRWVLTLGNRRWPLDPEPVENGNVVIVEHEGRVRARVLAGNEMPAQQPAYRMHACWSARPRNAGPRCRRCQGPMDPELTALERWVEHPCCEPTFLRELVRQGITDIPNRQSA